jgi:gamma-glutamyltranspeptidase/glutathione hydrolase
VGSPGGSRIPTTIAQIVSHLVDEGASLAEALSAPRFHHQWRPAAIEVEPRGLEAATVRALEARGHTVTFREATWGDAQAVRRLGSLWEAASDPRWEGAPAAP